MGTRARGLWRGSIGAALTLVLASGCGARPATTARPAAPATTSAQVTSPVTTQPPPSAPSVSASPTASTPRIAAVTFAVIGDYGFGSKGEAEVARMVASWQPSYIIATGDDYYSEAGGHGEGRYDASTARYYKRWLADVSTGAGEATRNAFFPCLGNHDYSDAVPSPATYVDYFDLPGTGFHSSSGNERYYDFIEGDVHFFVLNSNDDEPDGVDTGSRQARWLERALAASTSRWNVVYDHHPPYSSDRVHGSIRHMRWPFAKWGADVVLSGHAHVYERLGRDGITYFVNGLAGSPRYAFGPPIEGSKVRFDGDYGAQRVTVTPSEMRFEFFDERGTLIDTHTLHR